MAKQTGGPVAPKVRQPTPRVNAFRDVTDPRFFMWVSLGAFALGAIVLGCLVGWGELVARFGLISSVYYLAVFALGLCAAAFLFGVLRSQAVLHGQHGNTKLSLAGPAVIFVIVVAAAFRLAPPSDDFSVRVFLVGPNGRSLASQGTVGTLTLDFGADRRTVELSGDSQPVLSGIPARFRGQSIRTSLTSTKFDLRNYEIALTGDHAYVELQHKPILLTGRVTQQDAKPVVGASVSIGRAVVRTTPDGEFKLTVERLEDSEKLDLKVDAKGFKPWVAQVHEASTPVRAVLESSGRP